MHSPNYTFADLLHIFFALRSNPDRIRTYDDLAQATGISRRSLAHWFAGDYAPRTPEPVERLGDMLGLTGFQIDLMLYAINPRWSRYNTPADQLQTVEVIRRVEQRLPDPSISPNDLPSPSQIESTWPILFRDNFESNAHHWGLGSKDDDSGRVERSISNQCLELRLSNRFVSEMFIGADSQCFTPDRYYCSVYGRFVSEAGPDDGLALVFEEISDACHGLIRIRDRSGEFSVIQGFHGGDFWKIYLQRRPMHGYRTGQFNKIALLVEHQQHSLFINDYHQASWELPRLPASRIDLGIIAGGQQQAEVHFKDFWVRVPADQRPFATLEGLIGGNLANSTWRNR